MEMMRAWVAKPGELVLEQVPKPIPASDEVLIKIDSVCICNGSDPEISSGHEAFALPMLFGHEASGHIVQAGADVAGFSVGQRVCWWCTMGGFAEWAAVSPSKIAMFVPPPNVTREQAPVLELIIASARALMPFTDCCQGKTLAILGLGPSGLNATQYAKALGFGAVYGWDLYPARRALALTLGADAVYDPAAADFGEQIKSMPEADIALDMMGDDLLGDETFITLTRKVKPHGTIVSYGHPAHNRVFKPYVFQNRCLSLISPENDYAVIREKGKTLMGFVADGRVKVQPLITRVDVFENLGAVYAQWLERLDSDIKMIFLVEHK